MSNEIKTVCETYMVSLNLAFGTIFEEECGLKLEEADSKDHRLEEITVTAQRTGLSTILSKKDAVEKAVEDAVYSDVLNLRTSECVSATGNLELSLRCTEGQEFRSREEAKAEVKRRGVENILTQLSPNQRAAIEKEADRFMKDARTLIEKLKKSEKPPLPQETGGFRTSPFDDFESERNKRRPLFRKW